MTANDTKTYSASDIAKLVATGDHAPTAEWAKEAVPDLGRASSDNLSVVMPAQAPKVPIWMRLDPAVLAWFKQSGKGVSFPHERRAGGLRRGAETAACVTGRGRREALFTIYNDGLGL